MEQLLLRYISGIASLQERREVMVWIEADPKHKVEYEDLLTVYILSIWNDPDTCNTPPPGMEETL
ncbi:hypothetical protein [Sphingobacterium lumbrici]|uniref:hypothetical protein n=1 Tax=Sphingobacterium lumbrici TaxID=2559600 RepID=UPI001125E906|nr:hypothetical protein [Sphingobacterium lumbrici]